MKSFSKKKKIAWAFSLLILIAIVYSGYDYYNRIFKPNVLVSTDPYVYIHSGSNFEAVINELKSKHQLIDEKSFRWLALKMKYPSHILPGRYFIMRGMSNKSLVQLLRSGRQSPVKMTFNSVRTKAGFCSLVGSYLEVDSVALFKLLSDEHALKPYGLNKETAMVMFIPNTYEFYWNTNPKQFMDRMAKEYKKFWTATRKLKLIKTGLTQVEASILASIVEQETNRNDEKSLIAGVYLNRLKKGWKLEADPTVVFAAGDFTIRRVLNEHKEVVSPYNTYLNTGLPPGPICIPSISSIEAVLNYSGHEYLFFCAREDFSGYHAFAKDLKTHMLNAQRYRHELNRRNIRS